MQRAIVLVYAIVAYSVFLPTFLYLVAFVGNLQATGLVQWLPWLPDVVPRSIDAGRAPGSPGASVAIDLGLVLVFGLQHSLMARLGFKAWLARHLPASAERSTYVLLASLALILLFWQWRPIAGTVWALESGLAQALAWAGFASGFGLVLLSTFLIDHFDLFGLKQAWRGFTRRPPPPPRFSTPLLYRIVRHPLYLGFLVAFWATPTMSPGHLLFAAAMSAYILVAIRFEERDLVRDLGERYARYREQVPMLLPGAPRRGNAAPSSPAGSASS
jgi:protein-S-isoprenylcysteine O-methyltransferase Ste14